jgi:hypothetical protein
MAKFVKPVVKAGKYVVSTPNGGRTETTLTVERLAKWVDSFNRLKAKGYRTPAPFDHILEASPFRVGQAVNVPADKNGGFWNRLWLDGETLMGELQSPGKTNDPNSPASKIGTTVQETSVYAVPNWKDGTGDTYDEVLSHIALVVNPIEPGQGNFKPVEGAIALAMSQHIGGDGNNTSADTRQPANDGSQDDDSDDDDDDGMPATGQGGIVKQIVKALRQTEIGIDLPDDTNEANVLERLLVAARQKCVAKPQPEQQQPPQPPPPKPAQSLRKPPEGAVQEPTQVTMSTTPNAAAPAQDPVLMSQLEALKTQNTQLTSLLMASEANARAGRIAALLHSGRITKEYADKYLTPHLAGFQMSFGTDGKQNKHVLDSLLEAVEAMPAPARPSAAGFNPPTQYAGISPALAMSLGIGATPPPGTAAEPNATPASPYAEVTPADAAKLADQLLASL